MAIANPHVPPSRFAISCFGASQFSITLLSSSQFASSQFAASHFASSHVARSQIAGSHLVTLQIAISQFAAPQSAASSCNLTICHLSICDFANFNFAICIFTCCCFTIRNFTICSLTLCNFTICNLTTFHFAACIFTTCSFTTCSLAVCSFTSCSFTPFNVTPCTFTTRSFATRRGPISCGSDCFWALVFDHAGGAWGASLSLSQQKVTRPCACRSVFPFCVVASPLCFYMCSNRMRSAWSCFGRSLCFIFAPYVANFVRSLALLVCRCPVGCQQATRSTANHVRLTFSTFAPSQMEAIFRPRPSRTGSGQLFPCSIACVQANVVIIYVVLCACFSLRCCSWS